MILGQPLELGRAGLIGRYVRGISLQVPKNTADPYVWIDPELQAEVRILEELT